VAQAEKPVFFSMISGGKSAMCAFKEALIKSCHAAWRPFSRLAALSNGSISPASLAAARLAKHENDSPYAATAFNRHFLGSAARIAVCVPRTPPYAVSAFGEILWRFALSPTIRQEIIHRITHYLKACFSCRLHFASFQKLREIRRADAINCGKRISMPMGFDQKEVAS
jgi:hypothetical protein